MMLDVVGDPTLESVG